MRVTPGQFYPGQIFIYTSTASAASDKFHVCQNLFEEEELEEEDSDVDSDAYEGDESESDDDED